MEKKKRPEELSQYLEDTSKDNDAPITGAFEKLEDRSRRRKLAPGVAAICRLTGLSRNTIRNRVWALGRLKDIRADSRAKKQEKSTLSALDGEEKSAENRLRDQEVNASLCGEMEKLQSSRLRVV